MMDDNNVVEDDFYDSDEYDSEYYNLPDTDIDSDHGEQEVVEHVDDNYEDFGIEEGDFMNFEFDLVDPNVDEAYEGCLDDELSTEYHSIEFSFRLYEDHDINEVRNDCEQMKHLDFFYYPKYLFFSQNVEQLKNFLLRLLVYSYKIVCEHESQNWPLIKVRECAIILLVELKRIDNMYGESGYGDMLKQHGIYETFLRSLRNEKGLCAIIKLLTTHQDISMRILLTVDVIMCLMHRIVDYYEKKHFELFQVSAYFFISGFGASYPSINAVDDDGIQ